MIVYYKIQLLQTIQKYVSLEFYPSKFLILDKITNSLFNVTNTTLQKDSNRPFISDFLKQIHLNFNSKLKYNEKSLIQQTITMTNYDSKGNVGENLFSEYTVYVFFSVYVLFEFFFLILNS